MAEVVLKIEGVGKQYRLGEVGSKTISQDFNRWYYKIRGKEDPYLKIGTENDRAVEGGEYVWALQNINLEVRKGEVLGIIGRNGAGKSTLLKLLSKVTAPTKGEIKIRGRLASLLEVGTGFHPELTGRENIFLNGAILGMSKREIREKLDQIVDFSGCQKYLDTPVKRYSSGMKVRLGFAVAAHLEPEILVVDEVLAVGDAEFQRKCIGKMQDVAGEGRTVLFVSHNMSSINNLCQKCIVLNKGRVHFEGETALSIKKYLELNDDAEEFNYKNPIVLNQSQDKIAEVTKVGLLDFENEYKLKFEYQNKITVQLEFQLNESCKGLYANFVILDKIGNKVFMSTDQDKGEIIYEAGKKYKCKVQIPEKLLMPGFYSMNIGLNNANLGRVDKYDNVFHFEIIDERSYRSMKGLYRNSTVIAPELTWEFYE